MSPHLFLVDASSAAVAQVGSPMTVTGAEGQHAARVVRVRPGEVIELVDGSGIRIQAEVVSVVRDEVRVLVRQVLVEPPPGLSFVVVQALPKGEHADLAVDQLTQAGVDRIIPWAAANCVVRWDQSRAARGQQKWQQTAVAAAKQARRSRLPQVTMVAQTAEVLKAAAAAHLVLVLHEDATHALAAVDLPPTGEVMVVVGPEGGLADAERGHLAEVGAREVRLGPEVLRTSLAGAAALAVLSANSRWAAGPPVDEASPVDDASRRDGSGAIMQGWRA